MQTLLLAALLAQPLQTFDPGSALPPAPKARPVHATGGYQTKVNPCDPATFTNSVHFTSGYTTRRCETSPPEAESAELDSLAGGGSEPSTPAAPLRPFRPANISTDACGRRWTTEGGGVWRLSGSTIKISMPPSALVRATPTQGPPSARCVTPEEMHTQGLRPLRDG